MPRVATPIRASPPPPAPETPIFAPSATWTCWAQHLDRAAGLARRSLARGIQASRNWSYGRSIVGFQDDLAILLGAPRRAFHHSAIVDHRIPHPCRSAGVRQDGVAAGRRQHAAVGDLAAAGIGSHRIGQEMIARKIHREGVGAAEGHAGQAWVGIKALVGHIGCGQHHRATNSRRVDRARIGDGTFTAPVLLKL